MLRKTTFTEDSDQSISEEEDLALDWPDNYIHSETAQQKGGIQIQSQLELLRDSYGVGHGTEANQSLNKEQSGFGSEDEVEVPSFHDHDNFTVSPGIAPISHSNEGLISNDRRIGLHNLGSQKPDEACTWSAINKEAEALVHLTDNARSSSMTSGSFDARKSHKGSRGKAKPKLSFRFQSHREDTSSSHGCKNELNMSSKVFSLLEELKSVNGSTNENVMIDEPLVEGEMIEELDNFGFQTEPVLECGYTNRSMADLLDSYQDRNGVTMENVEMMVEEGNILPAVENEEPPEALDSGSSTDDETCLPMNVHNLGLIVLPTEQKTMTDKFEEVFGVVTANEEGPDIASYGIGVFGKLHQVMQSEKKREMEFLKRMQTCDDSIEETNCIDVEILSRGLEAKLVVCRCSVIPEKEHTHREESSHAMKENQNIAMTIIFNPRVCDDVELEVGNLIRIYFPWKEVQVGERYQNIILSTFFSQI